MLQIPHENKTSNETITDPVTVSPPDPLWVMAFNPYVFFRECCS